MVQTQRRLDRKTQGAVRMRQTQRCFDRKTRGAVLMKQKQTSHETKATLTLRPSPLSLPPLPPFLSLSKEGTISEDEFYFFMPHKFFLNNILFQSFDAI